jgi:hypothetical protein
MGGVKSGTPGSTASLGRLIPNRWIVIGIRRGVSKGVEDGYRPSALRASGVRGGPPAGRRRVRHSSPGET